MPLIILASVALQLFCLIHMVRSGRPYWWAFIIVIGSFLGSVVYLLTQVLPDYRDSYAGQQTLRSLRRTIDPQRERRRIEAELAVADNVQNRLRLARECLQLGDAEKAEELFQSCLKGVHRDDPAVLLGLAQAQMCRDDCAGARATLEHLNTANPTYVTHDGHLLYARALQGLGETEAALQEYAVLASSYPGEEARVRHVELLRRVGRLAEAEQQLAEIRARLKVAPAYYRRENREWIERAEALVKGSG